MRSERFPLLYYTHQYLSGSSPGQRLMGVHYANFTRTRGFLNLLLNNLVPTVAGGFAEESHDVRLQRLFQRLQSFWMAAKFLHLLFFLARGGPNNPIRRLLRIQTVYDEKPTIGELNESSLNRELLGHSIANQVGEFVERRRRAAGGSGPRTTADGLLLCDWCRNVVTVAVEAETADGISCVYCNHCFYAAKEREQFKWSSLLHKRE
ncbi:hypothetical protein M3Y99_01560400 [Aphelenchoides fujianensis]|nr:hypothetical protein M3Y99_01560400 [Aphelenchoides fujianensis]